MMTDSHMVKITVNAISRSPMTLLGTEGLDLLDE